MSPNALAATVEASAAERYPAAVLQTMNEETLLFADFLAGDDIAAIKVFKRYNRRLFVYCAKVLGNPEQAEDVVSAIWEKLVRLRANPPDVHSPMGLLLRMARNYCLNSVRSRREHVSISDIDEHEQPAWSPHDGSELEDALLQALDRLPFETREILVLNAYCGYRFDEIAEMLGKSPEAIWARASRARTQLRRMVLEHASDTMSKGATGSGEKR